VGEALEIVRLSLLAVVLVLTALGLMLRIIWLSMPKERKTGRSRKRDLN
jgi:hypothetical protein